MSDHVSEWLNAYYDGELHGRRLQDVETHLAACEHCQAELESLGSLSRLLHEVREPEMVSVDRFAAQVNLRLPRSKSVPPGTRLTEFGWWMIPVGLLASWVFLSTALILSNLLSVAGNLGVLSGLSEWLAFGPANNIYLSSTIGQAGLLSGSGLNWAERLETVTRVSLPQIILQVSIALLYLSWIAVWWARRTRQVTGQLLEG